MIPNLEIESRYADKIIAGIDEAGRGPLAGPVVAACVIIDPQNIIPGIKDSKLLSKTKREELFKQITANYEYSFAVIDHLEIDEINILNATKKACVGALNSLKTKADLTLIDGNMKFDDISYLSIVKGDQLSLSIAAASIIAKVTRDKIMDALHEEYSHYDWHKNKGYGTKAHIDAIRTHGLSPYHRKSFNTKSHF